MKTETFLRKLSVVLTAAILVVGVSACASHKATAGDDYGQVRTEASSTQSTSSDQVVGTAPAPANAQNVEGTTTPAVISGPAKVDSTGRAYTSSSVGSAGNASGTGLNTNVNIVPEKTASSNVTVTQSPAVSTSSTETTTQTTVAMAPETPAPAPAPTVAETPAPTPAPTVTESTTTTEAAPMTSSTTQESTTTTTTKTAPRRMRKD
jgi:hypothetical protein